MLAEIVMDASVAVKCLVREAASDAAVALTLSGAFLVAPAFIHLELASVMTKKVRRNEISQELGARLLADAENLLDLTLDTESLITRSFHLAAAHGFSVYDGVYLALAEERHVRVVTADEKLVRRARDAGFADLVTSLNDQAPR